MRKIGIVFAPLVALLLLGSGLSGGQARRPVNNFPTRGACFFKDANFKGNYFCVRSGESRPEMPSGFNDRISSIRVFGNASVTLFKDHKFQGTRVQIHRDTQDLSRVRGANDKISSLRVL